ncbi:hypothetical protein DXG01_015364 [Tephrocybe rancida]|nr:hypothetical protein DXG01_015364 [Tephrocybe rancida]
MLLTTYPRVGYRHISRCTFLQTFARTSSRSSSTLKLRFDNPEPSEEYLAATLLPPHKKVNTSRKLLVLDLNGVLLVRSPFGTQENTGRLIWPRPYMQTFRNYLFHPDTKDWLDTMVWSSAQKANVNKMVKFCFGEEKTELATVWARDKMGLTYTQFSMCFLGPGYTLALTGWFADQDSRTFKDLGVIWKELGRHHPHSLCTTLLMDDSYDKARLQPYNHIVVPEYDMVTRKRDVTVLERTQKEGETYDDLLVCVIGILDKVKSEDNVACWVRQGELSLGKYLGAEAGVEPWWADLEVKEHWREKGMGALDDMGIELEAAVVP